VKQPLWPQDAVIFSAASTGGPASGCRCGLCGTIDNGSCGWRGTSKAKPQARKNEHRKFCRSFMPFVPHEANPHLARQVPGSSAVCWPRETNRVRPVRLDGSYRVAVPGVCGQCGAATRGPLPRSFARNGLANFTGQRSSARPRRSWSGSAARSKVVASLFSLLAGSVKRRAVA
jgi:hypothetical protein